MPTGIVAQVCDAIGNPGAALTLMAGLGDVESAAPSIAMWDLGRQIAGSAELNSAFDEGFGDVLERLQTSDTADAQKFLQAFDEFLVAYGSRGPNEWEISCGTWETEPVLALAAIDRMRVSPASAAPTLRNDEKAKERIALTAQIVEALAGDPEAQGQFEAAMHAMPIILGGRERTKTNCVKMIQESRMAMLEIGRRMVSAGHFEAPRDYGMLKLDEMDQFLADPASMTDELRSRWALFEQFAARQEPFVTVGAPAPVSEWKIRGADEVPVAAPGDVLQGTPGCPGTARGRARVVLDSHNPTALEPGDIVVAPITDPSWTPLFVPAAGVVVDVGALLSHAVIVSRELGIPCAVSVTGATRAIPDGALIEVDGTTGAVSILES